MPMDKQGKVRVSRAVMEGLMAVRAGGQTNMLDWANVARLAAEGGHRAAADFVADDPPRYIRGVFRGFEVEEDGDAPERA